MKQGRENLINEKILKVGQELLSKLPMDELYTIHLKECQSVWSSSEQSSDTVQYDESILKACKEGLDKENYIILNEFLAPELAEDVCFAFEDKIKGKLGKQAPPFISESDKKPNMLTYGYPEEYFSHVKYLFNPGLHIKELSSIYYQIFSSIINYCLDSYSEIENMWIYKTHNFDGKETYNLNSNWHLDGDPKTYLKLIIYLCDVDEGNGPFSILSAEQDKELKITGKKGTAVLFRSSLVKHRAINTVTRDRYALSFLLAPSLFPYTIYKDPPFNVLRRVNPFLPM